MRYLITGLLVILVLALLLAWYYKKQYARAHAGRMQAESNVRALAMDNTKFVREITLSRADFKETFSNQADSIEKLGHQLKNVRAYHSIEYRYKVDTVIQAVIDSAIDLNTWQWSYTQGCLNSEFLFSDTSGQAEMKIWGEVPINITTVMERPRFWFWKLKWNPNKWPVHTEVETPCGLDIKQNIKFNIK